MLLTAFCLRPVLLNCQLFLNKINRTIIIYENLSTFSAFFSVDLNFHVVSFFSFRLKSPFFLLDLFSLCV